jgi:hypothetical protein
VYRETWLARDSGRSNLVGVDRVSVAEHFEIRNGNPKFLCRSGPAQARGERPSQKKLCFTGTNQELVARHLYALSQREDCYVVKFSVYPRGGMYLGRCFLTTDAAVGDVWARYHDHPSLFCTVQDDAFTAAYRAGSARYDRMWLDDDEEQPGLAEEAP